jgi:hypothetical protein
MAHGGFLVDEMATELGLSCDTPVDLVAGPFFAAAVDLRSASADDDDFLVDVLRRTNPAPPTMAPPPTRHISVARACIAVPSWLVQGLANPESVLAHWCAFPAACLAATGPRGGTPVDTNICGVLGASSGQCGGGDNGVGRASVERYGLRSVRHAPCTGRRTDVGFCDLGVHVRTVG